MVVSLSATIHIAGLAAFGSAAGAAQAVAAIAPKAASLWPRRFNRLMVFPNSSRFPGKVGTRAALVHLPMAKSSAKAPGRFLNGNAKFVSLNFQDLILTLHRYWG